MTSRHLVDPSLLPLLDAFALGTLSDARLGEVRSQLLAMIPNRADADTGLQPQQHVVPGMAGDPDVRVLVYDPGKAARPRPAILHIHGGGYVLGVPELAHAANAAWATALGAVVVSVDYRLAPEHPFPAALHDCLAALRWLHAQAASLGVYTARIAVLGESAGGGLAANLALRSRDDGDVPLALQMLIYPMLDDRTGADDADNPWRGEFIWTAAYNRYGWASYIGAQYGKTPPRYAAAARATDLRGLPPCFMALGSLDLFLTEDVAYASRLLAAGVPTELHIYPGGVHAFDLMPTSWMTARYGSERLAAMRRALHPDEDAAPSHIAP